MINLPTPVNETARISATRTVCVDIPHVDTPHYHMSILSRLINQAHKEFLADLSEHDKFVVRSCSDPETWYTVDLSARTCTCPDSTLNCMVCKHRIASHYIRQALYADNAFPDPTPLSGLKRIV